MGSAIKKSGIPREEIFLTTKVWIEHYGYENAKKSVLESMKKLQTEYLDLVLLHQPFGDAYGAWRALEDLYEERKIRAIGISNFYVDRMVEFVNFNRIKPMINQRGVVVIPKSTHYERMVENFNAFDFTLTDEEMNTIAGLDTATSSFFSHQDPAMVE